MRVFFLSMKTNYSHSPALVPTTSLFHTDYDLYPLCHFHLIRSIPLAQSKGAQTLPNPHCCQKSKDNNQFA